MAAEALESENAWDVCDYCNGKSCRDEACGSIGLRSLMGDATDAAADEDDPPFNPIFGVPSFKQTDPRLKPTYAAQPPLVRLREMVQFTRACVRRLRRHFERRSASILSEAATADDKRGLTA